VPRKREASFELKTIIWDKAATIGKKLEVILRELDYELERLREEGRFHEDTPDVRTIKRIIEKDINELSPEVVIAKLPPYMWHLRDDYGAIKSLVGKTTQEPQHSEELSITAMKIISNLSRYHRNLATDHDSSYEVGDLVYGGHMYEMLTPDSGLSIELPQVDRMLALNLLSHLKDEFPELANITDWAELTNDKITEDFLQRLTYRAHKGNFKGTCPVCKD